ncbi:hypothetical protein ACFQ4O_08120 [Methylopila musalis]|uniref:Uncharacterized protein n=1 Tax=Methylopila musalis TaxID=1134781 RepID=A0ABW3Z6S3_9HYPH
MGVNSGWTAIALAALALCGAGRASAEAAKPRVEVHRSQAGEKNAEGWYPATSTRGRFSGLSPIPFNDYTITIEDPNVGALTLHGVGSKSADGMEFGTIETVRTARQKDVDLRGVIAQVARKQGAAAPDIRVETIGREEIARAAFEGSARGVVMRASKTQESVFSVICEYPVALAESAKPTCEDYVASFQAGG